jgi:tripartite-type tricarboxylate transporter receptor subunit TctC
MIDEERMPAGLLGDGGTLDKSCNRSSVGEHVDGAEHERSGGNTMKRLAAVLLAFCGALLGAPVHAQSYPNKPITIVLPFAAGGPTDVIGRILARDMTKLLKQQVLIENATGAGGTLATGKVARAAPDGYTLLLHHNGMSTSPALYRKLTFDPLTDFEYVGLVADVPMTIVARPNFPPNTLPELLTYIRENRTKLTMGNAGLGAVSHQCGMLFLSTLKTEMTTVPYRGTGPAMNDLVGGQIDLLCDQTTQTTSYIRSGKVKVYGVTTRERVASLPDIPTLQEQGLAGFEMAVWHGIYAPKGTPPAVINRLSEALGEALRSPDVRARFADLGAEPVAPDQVRPEALRAHLKAEIEKWGPIIRAAGVYAE